MSQSKVIYTDHLPELKSLGTECLVIFDKHLLKVSKNFKKWLSGTELKYGVDAGEGLKDVQSFPRHILQITELTQKTSARHLTVVVVGGGSVGDFGGFVASVLKRGVRLVMIPSTWLAAVDSGHGGKTALNVGRLKNQIGTFYPASRIYLCRNLLEAQDPARVFEAFGEMLKIALLSGGRFWAQFSREKDLTAEVLWKYLPQAVKAKYAVVQKDPYEKSGHRHILNFGHTVGHALEVLHDLPHGVAINYGMDFSLRWGQRKKIMSSQSVRELERAPIMGYLLSATRDQLFSSKADYLRSFKSQLMGDKKKTKDQTVRFIFLKKPGQPVIKEVAIDDILIEACTQIEEEYG